MTTSKDEKLVIEGGKVKLLCQSRQIESKKQGGVIVDYFRFTVLRSEILTTLTKIPVETDDQDLTRLMALRFAELLGYTLGQLRPGRDYYEHTFTIENAFGHEIASVSGGGESQRGTYCFTLKGEGCTYAKSGWEKAVYQFFEPLNPKITRIDLAKDFYKGEVSIEAMVAAYEDHAFSYQNRLPNCFTHGDWIHHHSRTFQVGQRDSGKLCRGYEKDHQYKIFNDPWFRVEVEMRSVNRVIPWDALIRPGEYFAGAYEFCHWLVHDCEVKPIKTSVKVGEFGVQAAVNWLSRVVAPTLVQITSAMPDFQWLEHLVLDQVHRPIPRALRGLSHHAVKLGLDKAFSRINPNPGFASAV